MLDELRILAATENAESELLDFKREFAPEKKAAFWAEIVKDIAAFANTRGGVIVFGVEDDGSLSGFDCAALFSLDNAALVDQVRKYTDHNHDGLHIVSIQRDLKALPAIVVEPINTPLVFTKVGTYEIEPGKQKTAFSVGTIYVRHGSKSEPCSRSDLQGWIERELARVRDHWLGNIRKVVEAEPGSTVVVLSPSQVPSASPVRLTSDPNAPVVRLQRLSDGYPFRQSDVIAAINKRLNGLASINTHDIQTVKAYLGVAPDKTPNLVHRPHEKASPQYTAEFIERIVSSFEKDREFFVRCRCYWRGQEYEA